MTLKISFESTSPIEANLFAELTQYAEPIWGRYAWHDCHWTQLSRCESGHLRGDLVVKLQSLDAGEASSQQAPEDHSAGDFISALSVLCELSHAFEIDWTLHHEFESNLGNIRKGVIGNGLVDEIETSLRVARSLAGLISDDEIDDPFSSDGEFDWRDLDGQMTWEPELVEPLLRFPDLPELDDEADSAT
ncbi:hypothetical protein [Stieleria varia]|uniref:Uncharacterized protein n=1 Tax=Stieleria varia TaxID=2528005 RepID=A0A5C6A5E9_9BACT|nr:hypothetical protein [Stieleria varia]TWT94600.1 hypothetical protein Pla52n_54210 [Stieleria varia]